MNTTMAILIILVVTTITLSRRIPKTKPPKKADDRNIKVLQWERYGLKEDISIKSFREIMEKVAAFDSVRSCPLGQNNCDYKSIDYVLPRLIVKIAKPFSLTTKAIKNEDCIPRNEVTELLKTNSTNKKNASTESTLEL